MSDCSVNAWRRPSWGGAQWRAPDGRTVFVSEDDKPCAVSVAFTDGTTRDLFIALAGREVDHVEVDGRAYRPVEGPEDVEA